MGEAKLKGWRTADAHLHASFVAGESPDLSGMENMIRDLKWSHEFIRPDQVPGIRNSFSSLAGVPVRIVEAYDCVRDIFLQRIDAFAGWIPGRFYARSYDDLFGEGNPGVRILFRNISAQFVEMKDWLEGDFSWHA